MITIHIRPDDRYLLRFAFSPSFELVASFRALREPMRNAFHTRWAAQAQRELAHTNLALMDALIPPRGYMPDFLTPLPADPLPTFEDEMQRMRQTPDDVVRRDLNILANGAPDREAQLRPMFDNPRPWLDKLARVMTAYWRKAIAPHWPRMRTVLEGDLLVRARALAVSGPEAVLSSLHPVIEYRDGALRINKDHDQEITTGGDGMLLVPSVFAAPGYLLFIDTPPTPAVIFGARGAGTLWLGQTNASAGGLRELIGDTRADIITALLSPMTTAQLAAHLKLTAGAISQHLGALRRAGTVETHRQGRMAFHQLTPVGTSLVRVFES